MNISIFLKIADYSRNEKIGINETNSFGRWSEHSIRKRL